MHFSAHAMQDTGDTSNGGRKTGSGVLRACACKATRFGFIDAGGER